MANQLELLPFPIRPSTLACKKTEHAMAFFSRHSALSNHYPSTFEYHDETFATVEQYLAFKRAQLSQNQSLIERAKLAKDPAEAKSILNYLRKDHEKEWQEQRARIAVEGLREKFRQNHHLAHFLCDTHNLQLGEASKNTCWGIGMTLDDAQVLDTTKWNNSGNLLGVLLMQIRSELLVNRSAT